MRIARPIATVVAAAVLMAAAAVAAALVYPGGGPVHHGPVRGSAPRHAARPSPSKTPGKTAVTLADLSWTSADDGWALAGVPCGQNTCAAMARTTDGGRTWRWLPTPSAYLAGSSEIGGTRPLVSQVRFATDKIGYLFGPDLLITTDGGRTWARQPEVPGAGALEPTPGGAVLRVVYVEQGCNPSCEWQVQRSPAGSARWTPVLTVHPVAVMPETAQIVWQGDQAVYAVIYGDPASGADGSEQATIARGTDDGRTWTVLSDPCGTAGDAEELAANPDGFTAVLCTSTPGAAKTGQYIVTSYDGGYSWSSPRWPPDNQLFGSIVSPGGRELVAIADTVSDDGLVVSYDGGERWQPVKSGWHPASRLADIPSFDYVPFLGFEDQETGHWVGYPRTIWTTRDGGLRWTSGQFPETRP